ncbi:MAG: leucine-rich repeat domain-containing protein, partial [Clostridia bacterium]|nr:leucine-rich repeat domain-containing protein [Clostridia bacterium]
RNVRLSEGVEYLGNCFNECFCLKSIKIPGTVKFIDEWNFRDCFSLETIEYGGTAEEWRALENAVYTDKPWKSRGKGVKIVCTDGVIEPSFED